MHQLALQEPEGPRDGVGGWGGIKGLNPNLSGQALEVVLGVVYCPAQKVLSSEALPTPADP